MGILVDENTRLMVQGITGREGSFHALRCREYGANLVAGVTPGRGGQIFDGDVPVFNTVRQAVDETRANCALIFVPPPFAADAIVESVDAGIPTIACITEGIPIMDTIAVKRYIRDKPVTLIGPNCPGMITPGANVKVGIMPGNIHTPGRIGVVSRSGTLTYEAVSQLTDLGIGQSSCVGIGGDPVNGSSFVDILKMFNDDDETDGVGDDRRNWRHAGAGSRRVHQQRLQQADGSVHSRPQRPSRQAHGTRRRGHHRQSCPRRGEGEGARRSRRRNRPRPRRNRQHLPAGHRRITAAEFVLLSRRSFALAHH